MKRPKARRGVPGKIENRAKCGGCVAWSALRPAATLLFDQRFGVRVLFKFDLQIVRAHFGIFN